MFIVLLRYSENRGEASRHLEGHREWIRRGFGDGVFLLAGSLEADQGGGILAREASPEALRGRVDEDPFVKEGVVSAEIIEIDPAMTDERLEFLVGQ